MGALMMAVTYLPAGGGRVGRMPGAGGIAPLGFSEKLPAAGLPEATLEAPRQLCYKKREKTPKAPPPESRGCMTTVSKACFECGMPLIFGVAQCNYCGAKTGTVFDESAPVALPDRWSRAKTLPQKMDEQTKIEKAQDRANNSLVLALSSFFPLLGIALGIAAILYGSFSLRTLKATSVEDGCGSAMAGLVIGGLGLIAQGCWIAYALKLLSIATI
jgi:hypothetical protein